jgi:hypothetical protein
MGLLFFDQVLGRFSLGQQGIGGDVVVLEIVSSSGMAMTISLVRFSSSLSFWTDR